ncbi:alpha/beta hydrolase-fold protein [Paraglaciecola aquimarina]|uniref:Alpha/beta hydrolase-fold protein n=1 Tax=Paraglaciecola aquimarina TaxID=1235557 RepID=A0ABU3SXD8_9ALTE|nr:alpha/beta hydrolase-fold protein [Paraglaciecola aquimarina]MDU0354669.1 alpha/beta hydrolase-fold protein [Paraglaciecola aquimarina]
MRFLALLCAVSMFVSTFGFASAPSFEVAKGKLDIVTSVKSAFVQDRDIYVWLPPGYSSSKKYDVLYMHDGRMLFDANQTWNKQEWQVDEVVAGLIEQKRIRPIIVVGIPNAVENRHSEYFPQQPFETLSVAKQDALYQIEKHPGSKLFSAKVYSDSHAKFLIKEVIPYVESHYSVNKGGAHRYIAGSSMGGLSSWYTLMNYPTDFAGAICMSTHWPGIFSMDEEVFTAFKTYFAQHLAQLSTHKIYFDYGDATLDAMYPLLQKQIDEILEQQAYPRQQWKTEYFRGENHSENAWAKRLHIPLEFMFQ